MRFSSPLKSSSTKIMLLGSGELGKEVIISLQRLGIEIIAVDRYADAPGHQVAHRAYTIDMTNADDLEALIRKEQPDLIVPEIEAINTKLLEKLEQDGITKVIPNVKAVQLTMNREGIRRLAAEELKIPTSPYAFARSADELKKAVTDIGLPCFIKPTMSSSGKGQSRITQFEDVEKAWDYAASSNSPATKAISLSTPVWLFSKWPFFIALSVSIPFKVFFAAVRLRNPRLGFSSCFNPP